MRPAQLSYTMITLDTAHDPAIKAQLTKTSKGKKSKKHRNLFRSVPRAVREKLLEEAKPLWTETQPVSVAPVQEIMQRDGLGMAEKIILSSMMTSAPVFEHTMGTVRRLLSKDGSKKADVKTAARYLNILEKKGYIRREHIAGRNGGYYRYLLETLFLTPYGKNSQHNRILLDSTPNLTDQVGERNEEGSNESSGKGRITKAQSHARSAAQSLVQPVGDIKSTVNKIQIDSRRPSGWKNKLKSIYLYEEVDEAAAERRKRKENPSLTDGPEKAKTKVKSSKYAAIHWPTAKASQANALAWINSHPEGRTLATRLLDMSNQIEWTGPLARALFKRWQSGVITPGVVLKLRKVLETKPEETSLRYLIFRGVAYLENKSALLQAEQEILENKITSFVFGNYTRLHTDLLVAENLLRLLHSRNEVDYENVFATTSAAIPRYALLACLNEMGYRDLAMEFQSRRELCLEQEMADNFLIWSSMTRCYKSDPDVFFFDKSCANSLRHREKFLLQQECAMFGLDYQRVVDGYVSAESSEGCE